MNIETLGLRLALGLLAGAVLTLPATAQCGAADSFEENDDCASAATISAGLTTGLTCQGPGSVSGDDQDYYEITVPAGEILTVAVLHDWTVTSDIDSYLYDSAAVATCGDQASYLDRGWTSTDDEVMSYHNTSGASVDITIEVSAWTGGTTQVDCASYDLLIDLGPDPCAAPVDDGFEENDACAAAAPLTAGVTSSLLATDVDPDFYAISVPAGDILTVDVFFPDDPNAEVDLTLYEDAACGVEADSDAGFDGTAIVEWTNGTGSAVTAVLEVAVDASTGTCAEYALHVSSVPDPCLAGTDDSFEPNDTCATAASLAAGAHTGLFVANADEDYYTINVPAGDLLTVDVTYAGDPDVDLELFDDPACTNSVDVVFSFGGSGQVEWTNATGSAATVVLNARVAITGECNLYDLNVTSVPDPCLSGTDDAFEPNDTCSTATMLALGTETGLFAADVAPDYYLVDVPAGDILTVDVTYSGTTDVDLELFDDLACTNSVDVNFSFGGTGQVEWTNGTGATATVVLEVDIAVTSDCNTYDLVLSTMPDPCQQPGLDDSLEENDTCATAVPMGDGLVTGLFVSKADEDFYTVNVAAGDMLVVDVFNEVSNGDVDLYLYDDTPGACGDIVGGYIDRGYTSSDNEQVDTVNMGATTRTYYIQVVIWASATGDCNDDYDLQITGSAGDLATPFCFGDGTADVGSGIVGCPCGNESTLGAGEGCESSLGVGATLSTTGTTVVANDDLVFHIAQARPNQPSLLVQGQTLVAFPFKDGVLCMGTPTERIEIVFLDASGEGSTTASIVTEGLVTPGDTRYYQQWFRDPGGVSPCGTGSNFTQGLIVNWF